MSGWFSSEAIAVGLHGIQLAVSEDVLHNFKIVIQIHNIEKSSLRRLVKAIVSVSSFSHPLFRLAYYCLFNNDHPKFFSFQR